MRDESSIQQPNAYGPINRNWRSGHAAPYPHQSKRLEPRGIEQSLGKTSCNIYRGSHHHLLGKEGLKALVTSFHHGTRETGWLGTFILRLHKRHRKPTEQDRVEHSETTNGRRSLRQCKERGSETRTGSKTQRKSGTNQTALISETRARNAFWGGQTNGSPDNAA